MTDKKYVSVVFIQPSQPVHQLFWASGVELVFDYDARPYLVAGEDEFHGFARSDGARAENEIKLPNRRPQAPADPSRRLTTTAVQPALVILNILFPARLGVPQQVQLMHGRSPHLAIIPGVAGNPHDRRFRMFGSARRAVDPDSPATT